MHAVGSFLKPYPGFFDNLPGNLMGGLIAAVVALPLALAFGVASGLGAGAGLYGAIACGIFAGFFGGTRGQVSGPTGPMTVVAAEMFSQQAGQPELIFAAIILGGLLQVLMGFFKIGQLIHYIPYPVVSGFMSGIGLIIILVQIPPLFGLDTPANALRGLKMLPQLLTGTNINALGIGLLTIGIIYLLPKVFRLIPATLVALLACTLLVVMTDLPIPQINDVGTIPTGFPTPSIPLFGFRMAELSLVVSAAFSLALLGTIDSLLTSLVVDKITHTRHSSDKELFGQGLGNMVAGLFGGLPGAGATMRSVVAVNNGATSGSASVLHGFILLAVLLGLGSAASSIPLSCLAGILITVGLDIIDYRGLRTIGKAHAGDVFVMVAVLLMTVFLDLIIAVLIGLALAAFLFCKRLSELELSHHGHLDTLTHRYEVLNNIPRDALKQYYIYTFEGPLFFGEARNFAQVISALPEIGTLIINFGSVSLIDQTAAFALEDGLSQLEKRKISVVCVGMPENIASYLSGMGILGMLLDNCYDNLEDALQHELGRST